MWKGWVPLCLSKSRITFRGLGVVVITTRALRSGQGSRSPRSSWSHNAASLSQLASSSAQPQWYCGPRPESGSSELKSFT